MIAPDDAPAWTVVVLTGGQSRRMGRDKATLEVGGLTLLAHTLRQVPAGVPVVVAGPPVAGRAGVTFVQEDPPGGGPVAGLDAALTEVTTPVLVLLATDLPLVGDAPRLLASDLADLPDDVDALLLAGADGRAQQLCAAYRAGALRRAIAELPTPAGAAMRDVVARLRTRTRTSAPDTRQNGDATWDIDTPEDAERLAELLARAPEEN